MIHYRKVVAEVMYNTASVPAQYFSYVPHTPPQLAEQCPPLNFGSLVKNHLKHLRFSGSISGSHNGLSLFVCRTPPSDTSELPPAESALASS